MQIHKTEVASDNILTRRVVTQEAREASKTCTETMFDFCHGYETGKDGVSTHSCCHDTCAEGQNNTDARFW